MKKSKFKTSVSAVLMAAELTVGVYGSTYPNSLFNNPNPPLITVNIMDYPVSIYEENDKSANVKRICIQPQFGFTHTNIVDRVIINKNGSVTARLPLLVFDDVCNEYIKKVALENPDFKIQFPNTTNYLFNSMPFIDARIAVWSEDPSRPGKLITVDALNTGSRPADREWKLPLTFPTISDYEFFTNGLSNGEVFFDIKLYVEKVQTQNVSISSTSINRIISNLKSQFGEGTTVYFTQDTLNILENSIKIQLATEIKADMHVLAVAASLDQAAAEIMRLFFTQTVHRSDSKDLPDTLTALIPMRVTTTSIDGSEQYIGTIGDTRFTTKTVSKGAKGGFSYRVFNAGGSRNSSTTSGEVKTQLDQNGKQINSGEHISEEEYAPFTLYKVTVNNVGQSYDVSIFKNMTVTTYTEPASIDLPKFYKDHSMSNLRSWCQAKLTQAQASKDAKLASDTLQLDSYRASYKIARDNMSGILEEISFYKDSITTKLCSPIDDDPKNQKLRERRAYAAVNFLKDPLLEELKEKTAISPNEAWVKQPKEDTITTTWLDVANERLNIPIAVREYNYVDEKDPKKLAAELEKLEAVNVILDQLNKKMRNLAGSL